MLINPQKFALLVGLFYGRNNVNVSSSPAQSRRDKRNSEIRTEYKKLFAKDGLRSDVILARLADRYHLEPDTIERIVREQGYYRSSTVQVAIVVHTTEKIAHA